MSGKKTHRLVKKPKISAKDLAEFMDASETAKRTIIRACKFRSIGRITQHKDAKLSISKFIRSGSSDTSPLLDAVYTLRSRLADSDFDRDLYDHNADYIERFADVQHLITMPDGEILSSDAFVPLVLNGVAVNPDLQFRLRRLTKTNKVKVGGGMLRYAKGKALDAEVAAWQSAFCLAT